MKHKRSCKNDPSRKARVQSAKGRLEKFSKLSKAEQEAQKAANKAEYDSQHKS